MPFTAKAGVDVERMKADIVSTVEHATVGLANPQYTGSMRPPFGRRMKPSRTFIRSDRWPLRTIDCKGRYIDCVKSCQLLCE